MSRILRLSDYRSAQPFVHFDRAELGLLLKLYTGRVASGEWRDYAIDHGPGRAVFAVFRKARERPAFTIVKLAAVDGAAGYVVASSDWHKYRAASLEEALRVLEHALRLVT